MALIDCSECGKQVSSSAASCPNCGHPIASVPPTPPATPSSESGTARTPTAATILKICGVLFVLVVIAKTCTGSDSASSSSSAAVHEQTTQPSREAELDVTAEKLWVDYDANEVTADNIYKGKVIAVRGTIQSISKDLFDNAILHLDAHGSFTSVNATMNKTELPGLARLSKGQSVHLTCSGGGMVMRSPILRDCSL